MQPDPFVERLAKVRRRFSATLAEKIDEACAALPFLSGDDAEAVTLVAETYQQMHRICGVAPTVGFAGCGQAARRAEDILVAAFRGKRALTGEEVERLDAALATLKAEAARELILAKGGGMA